jgi:hypothetical protein
LSDPENDTQDLNEPWDFSFAVASAAASKKLYGDFIHGGVWLKSGADENGLRRRLNRARLLLQKHNRGWGDTVWTTLLPP